VGCGIFLTSASAATSPGESEDSLLTVLAIFGSFLLRLMIPEGHVYLCREHQDQTRLGTTSGAVDRKEYEVEAAQITEVGVWESVPVEE
jgi:hypothetical protein